jgi:hypothetical protein
MGSILDVISGVLNSGAVNDISRKIGVDPATTGSAIQAAMPLLLSALNKNASTPQGAQALHAALTKDHDGSVLDNISSLIAGDGTTGTGILKHLLGDNQAPVQSALGQLTGLDSNAIGSVLQTLAPMVMGALGKATAQQGLDPSGLAQYLGGQHQAAATAQPDIMNTIGGILNGTGGSDALGGLGKIVGSLFGGR